MIRDMKRKKFHKKEKIAPEAETWPNIIGELLAIVKFKKTLPKVVIQYNINKYIIKLYLIFDLGIILRKRL